VAGRAGIDYRFHDHRADGLSLPSSTAGSPAGLGSPAQHPRHHLPRPAGSRKTGLDTAKARALLLEHPAMIKRPLLDRDGELTLGFKADHYQSLFSR
jgi:hypothetical protein